MQHFEHEKSFFAIGWIPENREVGDVPKNFEEAVQHVRWRRRDAFIKFSFRQLFRTSNPAPALHYGVKDFRRFFRQKQYRMVLYLIRPHLVLKDSGKLSGHAMPTRGLRYLGFTPLRYGKLTFFARGEAGDNTGLIVDDKDPSAIQLSQRVSCRLSFFLQLALFLTTGEWAPYVWMEVTYRLNGPGSPLVKFSGSTIPSQAMYLGGTVKHKYDMLECDSTEVVAFVRCKYGDDAPPREPIFC